MYLFYFKPIGGYTYYLKFSRHFFSVTPSVREKWIKYVFWKKNAWQKSLGSNSNSFATLPLFSPIRPPPNRTIDRALVLSSIIVTIKIFAKWCNVKDLVKSNSFDYDKKFWQSLFHRPHFHYYYYFIVIIISDKPYT